MQYLRNAVVHASSQAGAKQYWQLLMLWATCMISCKYVLLIDWLTLDAANDNPVHTLSTVLLRLDHRTWFSVLFQATRDERHCLLTVTVHAGWLIALQIMNRWPAIRIDFISNIVVFGSAVLVSVVLPVNAGLAGLAITAAINLTNNLSWFVRMVSTPWFTEHEHVCFEFICLEFKAYVDVVAADMKFMCWTITAIAAVIGAMLLLIQRLHPPRQYWAIPECHSLLLLLLSMYD